MTYRSYARPQELSLAAGYGVIELRTPYNHKFLGEMKSQVGEFARRWDSANKVWWFDESQRALLDSLCVKHFGQKPDARILPAAPFTQGNRVLAEYVGRANGGNPARVYVNGEFSFLLTEQAMRAYFNLAGQPNGQAQTQTPVQGAPTPSVKHTIPDNPYSLLVVTAAATVPEIEKAYRRAARQWHPDVCHESDAADWFKAITEARYQLLDPVLRRQLDSALKMKSLLAVQIKSIKQDVSKPTKTEPAKWSANWKPDPNVYSFAPPLRCGWITPREFACGAYVKITAIQLWMDDIDPQGRTRVAYWDMSAKTIRTDWV